MANIIGRLTNNEVEIIQVDTVPSASAGTSAPIGAIAVYSSGTVGYAYLKTGSSDTSWDAIGTVATTGTVYSGVAGCLALYPSTGNYVDDVYVQNSQNINVQVAAQPTRSAAIQYNIPNPGDAITSADFVLTEGAQTINGAKAFTSPINMSNQLISNVLDPVSAQDAATKAYVDSVATGLDPKQSVKAATTANITLSGPQTVDGISVVAGNRVLVKNQTIQSQNGIYVVAAGAWTRSLDMDSWSEVPSAFTFVEQGTVNSETGWVCTSDQGGTIGTTAIVWAQFSGAGTYTAGNGLTLTGGQFSINLATASGLQFSGSALDHLLDGTTLSKSAAGLRVAAGGITNNEVAAAAAIALTKLAALTATKLLVSDASGFITASTNSGFVKVTAGTPSFQASISLTADVSGVLPIANGGTNSSTALNNNRIMVSSAGAIIEAAALTNGQLLIGSTGAAPVAANITQGTNQGVVITNGAGSIALSTVQDIRTSASPTFVNATLSGKTPGSVLFAGTGGVITEDNAKLFFDDTNNRLGIGTSAPARTLDVNGSSFLRGAIRYVDAAATNANLEMMQAQVSTTDATVTTIATIAVPTDSTLYVEATIIGRRTGGTAGASGDSSIYIRTARLKNVGGTVTLSNLQTDYTTEDQASWNGTITVSGTNALVRVNGAANNNVSWTVNYKVSTLS